MLNLDESDLSSPTSLIRHWRTSYLIGTLEPNQRNLRAARAFLRRKWKLRAQELHRPLPRDLSGACKFAALFAQRVFGGTLQSNPDHDYVICGGDIIDLTNADGVLLPNPYRHDRYHHLNREHIESLELNLPRVQSWVEEFLAQQSDSRQSVLLSS